MTMSATELPMATGKYDPAVKDYHYAVEVNGLTYGYSPEKPVLNEVNMTLLPGSRCLLAGDNGAGKSTLLKILGGRHSAKKKDAVKILNRRADFDISLNLRRNFLESAWATHTVSFCAYNVPLQADIPVKELMVSLQKEFSERRDELVRILDIDMDWRMNKVSDGQRRRVQLMLGLLRPVEVLLLDEVTTDLDLVTRQDFLEYLKKECETRGMTIVYATHIFEGLDEWATDLVYINRGKVQVNKKLDNIDELQSLMKAGKTAPLMHLVAKYIRHDRKARLDVLKDETVARREREPLKSNEVIPDGTAGGFVAGRFVNYWG